MARTASQHDFVATAVCLHDGCPWPPRDSREDPDVKSSWRKAQRVRNAATSHSRKAGHHVRVRWTYAIDYNDPDDR